MATSSRPLLLRNLPESSCSNLEHGTSTGSKGGTIWPYVTTHVILLPKATTAPFPCTYCRKNENCFKGLNAIVWHMNMNELASMARLAFISLKWTTGWITRNEATLHGNLWLPWEVNYSLWLCYITCGFPLAAAVKWIQIGQALTEQVTNTFWNQL